MKLSDIQNKLDSNVYKLLKPVVGEFRPSQEKAINAGLLENKSLLVCTPTASGKTLIAEIAFLQAIAEGGKAVYIVPLKALASEKFKDFQKKYGSRIRVGLSIGDFDSPSAYLQKYDLIMTTSEKFDSLIRHHTPWLHMVKCVIIDEIHLLNDAGRGPTLEMIITILKKILADLQIIGLSATIGNPEELAEWLDANLVIDTWRPVALHKGIFFGNEIEFYSKPE